MGNIAISVENLGKRYRIGQAAKRPENFREAVRSFVGSPFHYLYSRLREPEPDELIWALKDVSFEVKHGEVLGIIGRNGAGKSTLLKILSRITEPTTGMAKVYGRVGSLLEVGTGFHPELTGRENIYLNGAILGMRRVEINRAFDEIVGFSGVEKFLDTPVKRYSSGMYVRLAFAVAAHLQPETLIVDEVLAVGDAEFQKKCLGKMKDVAKEGRTVLFVSHNMIAIQNLCHEVVWLQDGKMRQKGSVNEVVLRYLEASTSVLNQQIWNNMERAPGNEQVRLRRVCIRAEDSSASDPITIQTPCVVDVEYWLVSPDLYINVTLFFYNEQGVMAFATASLTDVVWKNRPFPTGCFQSRCFIPGNLLNSGFYRIDVLIVKDKSVVIYRHVHALSFEVLDSVEMREGGVWYGKWPGVVRPLLKWSTERLTSDSVNFER